MLKVAKQRSPDLKLERISHPLGDGTQAPAQMILVGGDLDLTKVTVGGSKGFFGEVFHGVSLKVFCLLYYYIISTSRSQVFKCER